jgi:HD-like signal output (HDOD) protein
MSQLAMINEIDFKKVKIPPRPEALLKLSDQVRSEDPNINLLAEAISSDVSLAGAVLQVVNSPFFGLRNRLTSVSQATSLLGVKRFSNSWQQ